MRFCTVINCLDGRVQLPVIAFLKERFSVDYVDVVTTAGPDGVLAEGTDVHAMTSINHCVKLSLQRNDSVGIAVVGHYDCRGNPNPESVHKEQILEAIQVVRKSFGSVPVIGLWVDASWQVSEVNL